MSDNHLIGWDQEVINEVYNEKLQKLYEWNNIHRLDELIELMETLKDNERFLSLANEEKITDEKEFEYNIKKIPLHHGAKALGMTGSLPLYIPTITRRLVESNGLVAIMSMIQSSYVEYSGHYLTTEEDKIIKLSDTLYCLTFFVEDYDNPKTK